MDISKIKPYTKNAKEHPAKQIKQIAASIKEFGFNQPVVVDKAGVIIVGHGRYEAAKMLGMMDIPAIQVNLTEQQAKAYRLADNKLNESAWDMDLVIEELKSLSTEMLDLTGFSHDLILETDAKDDCIPDLPAKTKIKIGDMFALGKHRLLCGDSTVRENYEKVAGGGLADMVFTDPPYNVDYTGGMNAKDKNKRTGILNDKMGKEQFFNFLRAVCTNLNEFSHGPAYICMSSSELDTLKRAYEGTGGHWQSFIIWVKNTFTLSRADYQHTYEPMLYGWPARIKNHYFIDQRNIANVWEDLREVKSKFDGEFTSIKFQGFEVKVKGKAEGMVKRGKQRTDIWRYDKPNKSAEHPTMKPVAMVLEAIINSSKEGDIVLDPFLGSGTTLIAAEKSGRVCYGMELDPKYCDVIIQRWEEFTKLKVKKL